MLYSDHARTEEKIRGYNSYAGAGFIGPEAFGVCSLEFGVWSWMEAAFFSKCL